MNYNLVNEPWILLQDSTRISLRDLFSRKGSVELGGNPIERLLVFRLLLAICQRAMVLQDREDWIAGSVETMKQEVLQYLEKWKERFDLYDEKYPFLQFPQITHSKKPIPLASLVLGVSSGNATVITENSMPRKLSQAEIVYVLLTQVLFSFGGKKADASICLKPGLKKKASSPGAPTIGMVGYLHNYVKGGNLFESLYLNLISEDTLPENYLCMGIPVWEQMPSNEEDEIAETLKFSYLGRLVPLARFCHIQEDDLLMTMGIQYPGLSEGYVDLSVAIASTPNKKVKFSGLNAKIDKQPWRQMDAILAYVASDTQWSCQQLIICAAPKYRLHKKDAVAQGIWSVGLQLSFQSGEQYISASDGYVDSFFSVPLKDLSNDFYTLYTTELENLNILSKALYSSVIGYFQTLGSEGKAEASCAVQKFWLDANLYASELEQACLNDTRSTVKKRFAQLAIDIYDQTCPKETARQLYSWAENLLTVSFYLNKK